MVTIDLASTSVREANELIRKYGADGTDVVGGCINARENGEQRSPVPSVRDTGDDSERRVGI